VQCARSGVMDTHDEQCMRLRMKMRSRLKPKDLEERFSFGHCFKLFFLHVFQPFSTPLAVYLLGLRASKLCQLVPTSLDAFANTMLFPCMLWAAGLFLMFGGFREEDYPIAGAMVFNTFIFWLYRQAMIAGMYAHDVGLVIALLCRRSDRELTCCLPCSQVRLLYTGASHAADVLATRVFVGSDTVLLPNAV